MNGKKCKALRRTLKEKGFDWKQTKYQQEKLMYSNGEHPCPPIFLDPECGRALYRKNKKTLSGGK